MKFKMKQTIILFTILQIAFITSQKMTRNQGHLDTYTNSFSSSNIEYNKFRNRRYSKISSDVKNNDNLYVILDDKHNDDLVMKSTGEGETSAEKKSKPTKSDSEDDDKKTLSQQVADGKYGLIQNELFSNKKTQRPGVISYLSNPEVPKDNKFTFGGLKSDDIWLAEDHLLVLKGGSYPPEYYQPNAIDVDVKPIDNYNAPKRQVKIPNKPKIPPPFPVQLYENGPIEFIDANGTKRPIDSGKIQFNYSQAYPASGFIPGSGPFFPAPSEEKVGPPSGYYYPQHPENAWKPGNGKQTPLYPSQKNPQQKYPNKLIPSIPPSYLNTLPPGAVFLPPPNQTDLYDEDDPSIYYPPPYSFYYSNDDKNDSRNVLNKIQPGPLVPGIILPPPPDFFAPLEENNTSTERLNESTSTEKSARESEETTTEKKYNSNYISSRYSTSKLRISNPTTKLTTKTPIKIIKRPIYVPDENELSEEDEKISDFLSTKTTTTEKISEKTNYVEEKTTEKYRTKYEYENKIYKDSQERNYTKLSDITTPLKIKITDNLTPPLKTRLVTSTPYAKVNTVSKLILQSNDTTTKKYERKPIKESLETIKDDYITNLDIETNTITPQDHITNILTRQSPKIKQSSPFYYYYENEGSNSFSSNKDESNDRNNRQKVLAELNKKPKQMFYPNPVNDYEQQQILIADQIERIKNEIKILLYKNQFPQEIPQSTSKPIVQYSFQAKDYMPVNGNFQNTQTNNLQSSTLNDIRILQRYLNYLQSLNQQNGFGPIYQPNYNYQQNYYKQQERQQNNYYKQPEQPNYSLVSKSQPVVYVYSNHTKYQKPTTKYYNSANYLNIITTPNPLLNNQYYTKHDEKYLDSITKQYFNQFGQKISNNYHTTPLNYETTTTVKPKQNVYYVYPTSTLSPVYQKTPANQKLQNASPIYQTSTITPIQNNQYYQKPTASSIYQKPTASPIYQTSTPIQSNPYSNVQYIKIPNQYPNQYNNNQYITNQKIQRPAPNLQNDLLVNFKNPRPTMNPDSELIPIYNSNNPLQNKKPYFNQQQDQDIPLIHDIDVNYKEPRPNLNPYAEIITSKPNKPSNYAQVNPNAESFEYDKDIYDNIETLDYEEPEYTLTNKNQQHYKLTQSNADVVSNGDFGHVSHKDSVFKDDFKYQPSKSIQSNLEGGGAFISYDLPGNGAHFYFLTPQAVANRKKLPETEELVYYQEPQQRLRKRTSSKLTRSSSSDEDRS